MAASARDAPARDAQPRDAKGMPARGGALWLRRVGWLVLIWTASVLALGVAAYAVRLLMAAAGLTE